jgi:hypothetical protein
MPWVTFARDFTFTPDEDRRTAVKYLAGHAGNVRQQCADKAKAAGALIPPKEDPDAGRG